MQQPTAFANIEPKNNINDVCLIGDSGLMFIAGEQPKIQAYYLPALGTAPRWCSFLDSITEELESVEQTSMYEDYKFVTRQELEKYVSPLVAATATTPRHSIASEKERD